VPLSKDALLAWPIGMRLTPSVAHSTKG
jgi:hypothetical protein